MIENGLGIILILLILAGIMLSNQSKRQTKPKELIKVPDEPVKVDKPVKKKRIKQPTKDKESKAPKPQPITPLKIINESVEKPILNQGIKKKLEELSSKRLSEVEPEQIYADGKVRFDLDKVVSDGTYYVYKLKIGENYYVGFTSRNVDTRIAEHIQAAKDGVETMLYSKLRDNNFDLELVSVVEYSSELAALNGEREGIRNTPYVFRLNLTPGGEGYKFNLFKENGVVFFKPTERKHHE